MGYHFGGLITHFFTARKTDFVEMGLHHIVAIYLFGGLYLFNVWEIGSVIAYLHDIADITANLVKFAGETPYDGLAALCMLLNMSVWIWTRNYTLPIIIYKIYKCEA